MNYMFYGASSFNQYLALWAYKTGNVSTVSMFDDSGCPVTTDPEPNKGPWCQGVLSETPSLQPSLEPSDEPSSDPSAAPSREPSEIPSLAPSFSFCINDPTFKAKGNPEKDCDWIANNPTTRCLVDSGAELGCPAICNPGCIGCTDDQDYKYNGNDEKTCEWVAEKPDKRCDNGESFDSCQATCNPICKTRCTDNAAGTRTKTNLTAHGRQKSLKSVVVRATTKYSKPVQMPVILFVVHNNLL